MCMMQSAPVSTDKRKRAVLSVCNNFGGNKNDSGRPQDENKSRVGTALLQLFPLTLENSLLRGGIAQTTMAG